MDCISNSLAINYNLFIKDYVNPFVSWTYDNEYSNCNSVHSHYVTNAWNFNYHASYMVLDQSTHGHNMGNMYNFAPFMLVDEWLVIKLKSVRNNT